MNALDIFEAMEQKGMHQRGLPHLFRDLLIHYLGDLPDKRVLDAGCGTNVYERWLSRELAPHVGEMHGVDKYFNAWTSQDGWVPQEGGSIIVDGIRVHKKDAAHVDEIFPEGYFDVVVSTFFLGAPGIENNKQILEGLHKVTKPNGFGIHYMDASWRVRLGPADLEGIGYRVLTRAHDTRYDHASKWLTVQDLVPDGDFERYKHAYEDFHRRLGRYREDGFTMSTINDLFHTMILQKRG